jgi:hypothetical protein
MSLVQGNSPYIIIYKRSGDTFTKLTDPTTLPTGYSRFTAWSPDGIYMSVSHTTSPYITIYKRSGDTFTKLTDPAILPAGNAYGTAWSPDSNYMGVAHASLPGITIYRRNGDLFTKLADPSILPPTGVCTSIAWSFDGAYISLTSYNNYPYINIYNNSVVYKRRSGVPLNNLNATALGYATQSGVLNDVKTIKKLF